MNVNEDQIERLRIVRRLETAMVLLEAERIQALINMKRCQNLALSLKEMPKEFERAFDNIDQLFA